MDKTQTYDALLYKIVGAAMAVHSELKYGLLEPVYQEALCIELGQRGLEFCAEEHIPIYYKGVLLKKQYRMDIVCGDIIVELKSVEKLKSEHTAQLLNYLKATNLPLGVLINFGETPLKYKIVPNFISSKNNLVLAH